MMKQQETEREVKDDGHVENESDDDDDDDDEWYAQMEKQASFVDNVFEDEGNFQKETENADRELTEEEYFNRMHENNAQLSDEFFKTENDVVWQSLMRQLHSNNVDLNKKANPNPRAKPSLLTEIPISLEDIEKSQSSLFLLKQWLFSHLPASSVMYHIVDSFHTKGNYWLSSGGSVKVQHSIFIDSLLHPSFIANLRIFHISGVSEPIVEIKLFYSLPLYHLDNKKLCLQLTNHLLSHIALKLSHVSPSYSHSSSNYPLKLAAFSREFYEQILAPFFTSNESRAEDVSIPPTTSGLMRFSFRRNWDEDSFLYVSENSPDSAAFRLTDQEEQLLKELQLNPVTLRKDHVDQLDSSWKYRSDTSLDMVRRIIAQGRTIGLENEQTGELVAWCVTYDYGALGMLQTKETLRGKGLGRIVVKLMITKLFKECDYSSQAFCFIEAQNVASMRLFESLGFRKSADSLWAGLTVCPAPPPR